jgi:dTDP-4-amino-4,6-dideoxygalactose transaminase
MEAYHKLEVYWADYVGVDPPQAVACSIGSSALHLALEALALVGDKPITARSQVIVPEFTMVACARAVSLACKTPVFADCGDDLLMRPEEVQRLVGPDTFAIMPVHIYGRGCDTWKIASIAEQVGCFVVEDCAEYHGAPLSGIADAYCWSFYKNKIVCGEEGGMIVFHEEEVADVARMLRSQGFTDAHDFRHVPRGINARMPNAQAEKVCCSLANIEFNLERRREVEAHYNSVIPAEFHMPPRDVVWVYDMRLPTMDAEGVVVWLNANGVPARMAFKPMSEQEEYRDCRYISTNAFKQSHRVLYIPVIPEVSAVLVASCLAEGLHRIVG